MSEPTTHAERLALLNATTFGQHVAAFVAAALEQMAARQGYDPARLLVTAVRLGVELQQCRPDLGAQLVGDAELAVKLVDELVERTEKYVATVRGRYA